MIPISDTISIRLHSSAISRVDYSRATRRMHVWFTSGSTSYTHYRVPEHRFDGLINAPSAGRYYHEFIRGQYLL